jgi:hypothetical protein
VNACLSVSNNRCGKVQNKDWQQQTACIGNISAKHSTRGQGGAGSQRVAVQLGNDECPAHTTIHKQLPAATGTTCSFVHAPASRGQASVAMQQPVHAWSIEPTQKGHEIISAAGVSVDGLSGCRTIRSDWLVNCTTLLPPAHEAAVWERQWPVHHQQRHQHHYHHGRTYTSTDTVPLPATTHHVRSTNNHARSTRTRLALHFAVAESTRLRSRPPSR